MERVLIGLLVLGFMMGTMLVAARLAVGRPGPSTDGPMPIESPRQPGSEAAGSSRLVDSALRSALE
jgi:hypothetical protein